MRTKPSSRDTHSHIRKTKKLGDQAIVNGLWNAEFLKLLVKKKPEVWWHLITNGLQLLVGALAYSQNALYRRNFGFQTTGIVLSLLSLNIAILWNSALVPGVLKPFLLPFIWLFPIFKDGATIWRYLTVDISSLSLLIYTILLLALSLLHVVMIYAKGGNASSTKRGESWLYTLLSRRFTINEYVVCGLLEPLISIAIGLLYWTLTRDHFFAVYLWSCAGAVAIQQLADVSEQAQRKAVLNI